MANECETSAWDLISHNTAQATPHSESEFWNFGKDTSTPATNCGDEERLDMEGEPSERAICAAHSSWSWMASKEVSIGRKRGCRIIFSLNGMVPHPSTPIVVWRLSLLSGSFMQGRMFGLYLFFSARSWGFFSIGFK